MNSQSIVLMIAGVLVACFVFWGIVQRFFFSSAGHSPVTTTGTTATVTVTTNPPRTWRVWFETFTLKGALWYAFLAWVGLMTLPWIVPALWNFSWWNVQTAIATPTRQPIAVSVQAPVKRILHENRDRYKFFVEGPRKQGWKVIPNKVTVDVPLDGQPRPLGINLAFFQGSQLKYTCPGYWSGGEVKLFMQASEPSPHHLAHEETLPIYATGSVTGGDAVLIWGEKTSYYQAVSNRVIAEVCPLPNHIRIATTKRVLTRNPQNPQERYAHDWGTVQVGNAADSPSWQVYIRYADMNGITLSDDLVQQKPGQVMIGVMENNVFRDVLKEETVVSKPANLYGTYSVPSYEEDLFLRIQPPNVPEGEVTIEVIYDIDYTAR